jgi:hypothetical protein
MLIGLLHGLTIDLESALGSIFYRIVCFTKTANALREVLQQFCVPFSIWTDNGTEFKGNFQGILEERGMRHIHSTPYNPSKTETASGFGAPLELFPTPTMSPNLSRSTMAHLISDS